jgi:hypothetical protein
MIGTLRSDGRFAMCGKTGGKSKRKRSFHLSPEALRGGTFLAALVFAAATLAGEARRVDKRFFPLEGSRVVEVDNPRGEIRFLPGDESGVTVEMVSRARGEDPDRLLREVRLEVRRGEKALILRVRGPERRRPQSLWRWLFRRTDRLRVDLTVGIPADLRVVGRTTWGDLEARDLRGSFRFHSAAGDVRLLRIDGPVEVRLASGDLSIREGEGDTDVQTSSGEVWVKDRGGRLEIATASGDVTVIGWRGSLETNTASGDVRISRPAGPVEVSTSSGSVSLEEIGKGDFEVETASGEVLVRLVPRRGARYRIRSASGDVKVLLGSVGAGLDIEAGTISGGMTADGLVKIERIRRHRWVGSVGAGGARLRIETTSGDIRIRGEREARR